MTTKTTKPKTRPVPGTDSSRSTMITIGDRQVELVLTTRATRIIAGRYGGLENLGEALQESTSFEQTIGEVIWLITLLANQSIQIHNLKNPTDPLPELSEDEVELLTVPADLASYREAISEALYLGTRREIISDNPKP